VTRLALALVLIAGPAMADTARIGVEAEIITADHVITCGQNGCDAAQPITCDQQFCNIE
jgi:hypothetical protein